MGLCEDGEGSWVLTLIASMAYSTGVFWLERGWVVKRDGGVLYLGTIDLLERRCLRHDLEGDDTV